MTIAMNWPSSTLRSQRLALGLVSVSALLIGGVELGDTLSRSPADVQLVRVLSLIVAWIFVGAGVLAWSRRPVNQLGFVISCGGFVLLVNGLDITGVPVLAALATLLATVSLAVMVHMLHAFPSGRLPSRASRLTVGAGYLVCLVLQAPLYLFTVQPAPYQLLSVADRPELVTIGRWIQSGAGASVMVATTVILAGRLRRAAPSSRRTLVPLYSYGMLAVLLVVLIPRVLAPLLGLSTDTYSGLQLILIGGTPVAFTLSLLRGGFARTGQIDELSTWLGSVDGVRGSLTAALARALGDASLRLVYWVPDRNTFVDNNGDDTDVAAGADRAAVDVSLGDHRIAAIEFDPTLNADFEAVRAAGRVVAISIDHERVTAELRASQLDLRQSRTRIIEAGDAERRRIARDLHDGLQMRLVLLAMQAHQVAEHLQAGSDARSAAIDLRRGIDAAAAELRDLVHAVLPAALIERGLCAATEDLVDHLPVPTHLVMTIDALALPAAVESTAYFVIAEALTNALKHAQPKHLTVELTAKEQHLSIAVADDGVGGADLDGGTGLRGLIDRIDTLGGQLHLDSPVGDGTRILVELPCAS